MLVVGGSFQLGSAQCWKIITPTLSSLLEYNETFWDPVPIWVRSLFFRMPSRAVYMAFVVVVVEEKLLVH